ncbi:MAG: hypothetical protein ACI30W_03105 [Muribaculaceae bacterium]
MKKIKLALCAALAVAALSLTSCKNCVEQEIEVYKEATEKVKKAQSKSEIREIKHDVEKKVSEIITADLKEYYELTSIRENKQRIDAAEDEWKAARDKRKEELKIEEDDSDGADVNEIIGGIEDVLGI